MIQALGFFIAWNKTMNKVTGRLLATLRMRQLELISTLAELGNMRAAGEKLHLSTAAISKGLREVESLFGTRIFDRLPRGVVATAAGQLIVMRARMLLNEVAHLSDELAAGRVGDSIKIGAPPFLAWTLVPHLLKRVPAGHTAMPVRILEGRLADMCRYLENGDIDVLVTMNTPSELGSLKGDGFAIEQIGMEQWIVVCAPGDPLARRARPGRPYRWRDLDDQSWILPPRPTQARMMVEQIRLHHELAPIVPRIESMNAITNLQLTEQELGITLAARSAAADRLRRATLVEVPMEDLPPAVPIALVYRLRNAQEAPIAALRAAVQRFCKDTASVAPRPSASSRKFSERKSRS